MMELAPHSVLHTMPLDRLHRYFRALGLRHLFVTDTRNEVMGVITRKDLLPQVLPPLVPPLAWPRPPAQDLSWSLHILIVPPC